MNNPKIGIVACRFNEEITKEMLRAAQDAAKGKMGIIKVLFVPGAYDAPFAINKLLSQKDISGVAVLGAIIKGDTNHDEVIANATAKTIQELSIKHNKPIAFGIAGPGMNWKQAESRKHEYGQRAMKALFELLTKLEGW